MRRVRGVARQYAGDSGGIFGEFLVVFAQGTGDECRVPSGLTLKVRVNVRCALR